MVGVEILVPLVASALDHFEGTMELLACHRGRIILNHLVRVLGPKVPETPKLQGNHLQKGVPSKKAVKFQNAVDGFPGPVSAIRGA